MARFLFAPLILTLCSWSLLAQSSTARIYETEITIPTYGVGEPDPNPRFFEGRTYQGAQGRIYPYAMVDVLTNEKSDKTYTAIVLENEFIEVGVLPELGGRIFWAVDKTNGYDFFYRQHVIKPTLIGMLGAWISGGVEWNIPHHHRANSFLPMDWTIEENENGSKTLWLTEIERRHRMKLLVGLTIQPDRSTITATVKLFNRTPLVNSFLYFANPSVHVDSTYQVIFPPEVEYVTQHAKREFSEWPNSESYYGGMDYTGRDISWWKNLPNSVSFFAWKHQSDYFAGYDHGKDAGTAYVGDRHIAPGKKFFAFGNGTRGYMWDEMLTDDDGPYLELMAGAFSDNQPDYSWIQPYETKSVTQTWFPIRNLGGLTYANEEGALHLVDKDGGDEIRLITTRTYEDVEVSIWSGKVQVGLHRIAVGPGQPVTLNVDNLPLSSESFKVEVAASGTTLMTYEPIQPLGEPKPKPVVPPGPPEEIETIEELYLAGLRLDQFQHATRDPYPYYEEALKRDPMDSRVNTQMGILLLKRGLYADAENYLRRAVERLSHNYTRVRNGESLYYLGVTLERQGKIDEAYDVYYDAIWSDAWRSAGYQALARISSVRGDWETALSHIDDALAANQQNTAAWLLKSAVLRRLDMNDKARGALAVASEVDPLHPGIWFEEVLLGGRDQSDFSSRFTTDPQILMGVATDYSNAGLLDETKALLEELRTGHSGDPVATIASYWLASIAGYESGEEAARSRFAEAASLDIDYAFPFRWETAWVFEGAIESNPTDANAHILLGNLLYDHQPERAVHLWERAAELDSSKALAFRNLGYAYGRSGRYSEAIDALNRSIELNPSDARLLFEVDQIRELSGVAPEERLAFLREHRETVDMRDDVLVRFASLLVTTGVYDEAIDLLTSRHVNVWEGGGDVHGVFVDAHMLRGLKRLADNNSTGALADFETANTYPRNLEVGRPVQESRWAQNLYFLGLATHLTADARAAHTFYEQASSVDVGSSDYRYWQALALQKLDRSEKARDLFGDLIASGKQGLEQSEAPDFFAKFGERQAEGVDAAAAHYTMALGLMGLDRVDEAKAALAEARRLDPTNAWYMPDSVIPDR